MKISNLDLKKLHLLDGQTSEYVFIEIEPWSPDWDYQATRIIFSHGGKTWAAPLSRYKREDDWVYSYEEFDQEHECEEVAHGIKWCWVSPQERPVPKDPIYLYGYVEDGWGAHLMAFPAGNTAEGAAQMKKLCPSHADKYSLITVIDSNFDHLNYHLKEER